MGPPPFRGLLRSLGPYRAQIAGFGCMLLLAAAADLLLHATGLSAVGNYAGYLGSLLIVVSFTYSARKRKWVSWSSPRRLLTLHKVAAWLGAAARPDPRGLPPERPAAVAGARRHGGRGGERPDRKLPAAARPG